MKFEIALRQLLLLFIFALGWFYCARRHVTIGQNSQEKIAVPRLLAIFFSGFRSQATLDYPALIFQLTILLFAVVISLVNLGQLSKQDAYHYLTWPTILLGLFMLNFLFRK